MTCGYKKKREHYEAYRHSLHYLNTIQITHQTILSVLAQILFDEQFGRLRTNATTLVDNVLLAQVTL